MKKLLSIMLAVCLLATMSVTAFAGYNTSVTYDMNNGNAVVKTSGTANAAAEVIQVLSKASDFTAEGNIIGVNQTTAGSDGKFNFVFEAVNLSGVNNFVSIVNSEDGAINFGETSSNEGTVTVTDKVTLTIKNADLLDGITVYPVNEPDVAVTISSGLTKTIYTAKDSKIVINIGTKGGSITAPQLTSGIEYATGTSTVEWTCDKNYDLTVGAQSGPSAEDIATWIASTEDNYHEVMSWDAIATSITGFTALEGSFSSGDELGEIPTTAKELSVLSKIAKNVRTIDGVEYGIIVLPDAADETTLTATTEGAYILNCLGNTDGVFAIKAIDMEGNLTKAAVCTYVKYNDTYRCGPTNIVTLAE